MTSSPFSSYGQVEHDGAPVVGLLFFKTDEDKPMIDQNNFQPTAPHSWSVANQNGGKIEAWFESPTELRVQQYCGIAADNVCQNSQVVLYFD